MLKKFEPKLRMYALTSVDSWSLLSVFMFLDVHLSAFGERGWGAWKWEGGELDDTCRHVYHYFVDSTILHVYTFIQQRSSKPTSNALLRSNEGH